MSTDKLADALRKFPEQWDRDAKGCERDGYMEAATVKADCARQLREALAEHDAQPAQDGEAVLPLGTDPEAWTFQHEDTGRMTTLENDGINNPENFVANNPRFVLCEPLYSAKQVREAVHAAIAARTCPLPAHWRRAIEERGIENPKALDWIEQRARQMAKAGGDRG